MSCRLKDYRRIAKVADKDPVYPMLQHKFCDHAEQFIEQHRDRPFFLELALSSPRLPN